jgi:transposase-like protein
MTRQKFSREYKLEPVKQVRDRGVSGAQMARDLGISRTWLAVGYVRLAGMTYALAGSNGQSSRKRRTG